MKSNFSQKFDFNNKLIKQTYKKLKFLKQRDFNLFTFFDPGFAIHVVVPELSADYRFSKIFDTLEVIDTNDTSKIKTYKNYDFKLFIKVMKKILRRKSFNLRYEDWKYEKI